MVATRPMGWRGIFAGGVKGAEVDDCCFVGGMRRRGWVVNERSC